MPKILFKLSIIVLLVMGGTVDTFCSERKLTLTEAIKTALTNNSEIKALKNSLLAQEAEIGSARSSFFPRIGFEERATKTNNAPNVFMMKLNQGRFSQSDFAIDALNNPQATSDLQTLFYLNQPIFDAKAFIGLDMAKKEYSAQEAGFNRKKEETALKVARTFLQVQTVKEYLQAAHKALEDARDHRRIAEERFKNGLGLYSDTLRAETAVKAAEQQIVSMEKNREVAKRMLGLLLGTNESIEIDVQKIELSLLPLDYYNQASSGRKDLKALQIRQQNAQNSIKLAESRYLPTLHLSGTYQMNDHNNLFGSEGESWLVMASLRWDLFDGTNREYERTKALHKSKEVEEHLKGLEQYMAFKIQESYLGVEEARKNVELAKTRLKTAEEGQRLVKTRYENSLSPYIDFLDVQLQLDQARVNTVAKENDYWLAIINLGYESGTILADMKIE
jgi:outer membrane protein TolC